MKKINKSFTFIIKILIITIFISGLFLIDIGINSQFFIKKNFNQAYKYLITGDCDSYTNYVLDINDNIKEEHSYCKKGYVTKINILNITHRLGSNLAFLQVKYTFDDKSTYIISKGMKKDGFMWKIE